MKKVFTTLAITGLLFFGSTQNSYAIQETAVATEQAAPEQTADVASEQVAEAAPEQAAPAEV